ncbi:MAG: hypothetical protein RL339_2012 [Pseudomonadota bacterium]
MRRRTAILAASLPMVAAPTLAAPEPALQLTLLPIAETDGRIERLEVTQVWTGVSAQAGAPVLRLPLIVSNVDTVATGLTDLVAHDARGALSLTTRDVDLPVTAARDAEAGGPSREWIAARAITGKLTVRYSMPAQAVLPPRGAAPPFSFSGDGGGVSAAGQVFLLLPPGDGKYRLRLNWDLSAAPRGTQAVSSLGIGNQHPGIAVSGAKLRSSFYMAGPLQVWPGDLRARFIVAAQGSPGFFVPDLASWAARLHTRYAAFFGQQKTPAYVVFLRHNPINAGGGVGLDHSFVLTFGKNGGDDAEKLKLTLAHEMFHTFQPFIAQPAGLESSWFGEGLASLYEVRLPLRFGQIRPPDFLDRINFAAGRYYTSAMATVPNAEVPRRFWADTRIRTLPYDRGMLYFAAVDAAMRRTHGGKRSLDDLVLATLSRQAGGARTSNADWEALLEQELGLTAVSEFRAFLNGALQLPPSDAFGPCFRRTTRPLRRYEVGFEPAVLAEPRRVVRGVIPGSAAAAAGLRDGDEIVDPVPQDGIQGNQTQQLTLKLRRGDDVFSIKYLPRGETVDSYQWERVADVADDRCAL